MLVASIFVFRFPVLMLVTYYRLYTRYIFVIDGSNRVCFVRAEDVFGDIHQRRLHALCTVVDVRTNGACMLYVRW